MQTFSGRSFSTTLRVMDGVATPADPRGEKKLFLQILGGGKHLEKVPVKWF